jgi:hypothetical protein
MARQDWLDEATQTPLIDDHAKRLGSFVSAMADGVIDSAELKAQEDRLVTLIKEVEPQISDDLHAKMTELLCEVSAYSMMQVLEEIHNARPKTVFQG